MAHVQQVQHLQHLQHARRAEHTDRHKPVLHQPRKDLLLFGLSFVVFLVIALAGALLGRPWRDWLPGAEGVGSLYGGVKAAVYTFMSHVI